MGYLIEDKKFINDNIFKFEKRLESQYTIFTDKTPTFVTYYHINNINSISDSGFQNVEKVFGKDSPLRFQEINDFPIYGIDNIKLDLSDEDEGLTSNYEGEGIILPNTIKPLPNDFFTISYLNRVYIFMVTAIDYDTIKSNNYYKINFYYRTDSEETFELAQEQVLEKYNCIFKNIGTEDKCLIKDDEYRLFVRLNDVYRKLVDRYNVLFYSNKFNSYLFGDGDTLIYDKYLTHFINSNSLFNEKEQYKTVFLSNEDWNIRFVPEYDDCIFSLVESRSINELKPIRCLKNSISYEESVFRMYNMDNVRSVMFIDTGSEMYIKDELIDHIKKYIIDENATIIESLLVNYFNDGYDSIYNINLDKLMNYKIKYNYDDFILIPIILYILRFYCDRFMIN